MTARHCFAALLACAGAAGVLLHAAEQQVGAGRLNADQGAFDLKEGFHHFQGHVQFRYPGVIDLDCDDLKIRLLPGGRQIDRLIASNNVVTLTGSPESGQPWVERAEGSFKADEIVFDRANDRLSARGNFQMIIVPDALPKDSALAPKPAR